MFWSRPFDCWYQVKWLDEIFIFPRQLFNKLVLVTKTPLYSTLSYSPGCTPPIFCEPLSRVTDISTAGYVAIKRRVMRTKPPYNKMVCSISSLALDALIRLASLLALFTLARWWNVVRPPTPTVYKFLCITDARTRFELSIRFPPPTPYPLFSLIE